MRKRQHFSERHKGTLDWLSIDDLEYYAEGWIKDVEARGKSAGTVENYRQVTDHLLWFLRREQVEMCGPDEMVRFFAYLNTGHREPAGRWEGKRNSSLEGSAARRAGRPLKASTLQSYHIRLTSFFGFVILCHALDQSPLADFRRPTAQNDQIQPFTREHIHALLAAAEQGQLAQRNRALILFMLDTGARAAELCGVQIQDLDLHTNRCRLHGKGGKDRMVCLSPETSRALWAMLGKSSRRWKREDLDLPLFRSQRGKSAGEALTPTGLGRIMREWGIKAKIQGVRCSPHTLRHTFAVEYLKAGGDAFSLKEQLGHSSLSMTNRYVSLANADIEAKHRQFSPVASLFRKDR